MKEADEEEQQKHFSGDTALIKLCSITTVPIRVALYETKYQIGKERLPLHATTFDLIIFRYGNKFLNAKGKSTSPVIFIDERHTGYVVLKTTKNTPYDNAKTKEIRANLRNNVNILLMYYSD